LAFSSLQFHQMSAVYCTQSGTVLMCVCVCLYMYISQACYNRTPHLIHGIQSCKYPAEFIKLKTGYMVFDQARCLNLASLYNFITLYPNACKYVHALLKSKVSRDCISYFKHHNLTSHILSSFSLPPSPNHLYTSTQLYQFHFW
jgi:hypothetical protein